MMMREEYQDRQEQEYQIQDKEKDEDGNVLIETIRKNVNTNWLILHLPIIYIFLRRWGVFLKVYRILRK